MARLARLTVPGLPHHVIHRGNNRQPISVDAQDQRALLDLLRDCAAHLHVAVHAYVLMPNHLHLLLTPETATGVPQLMQALGRRYVRAFNVRHQRSGTLWEGRYRANLIQPERHLLPCMAYFDQNPVRAGLVATPADYPWSSHAHYTGTRPDRLITPHPLAWTLGNTPFAREARYAELTEQPVGDAEANALTTSALSGWALGDAEFVQQLQAQTERRVTKGRAGRPVRVGKENE